jgi:predicted  nucleic acid-binding Zn-ribbon protein
MSEIQRWGISHIHQEEFKSDTGRYVLYTDVLAALAEKEREIVEEREEWRKVSNNQMTVSQNLFNMLDGKDEEIAALTARIKELEEALEKIYWEISDRLWSHS